MTSILRPPPFRSVSSLTFDHANQRSAQLEPNPHNSFDGAIGFQMIYGQRRTTGMGDFCASLSGRVWTFDR